MPARKVRRARERLQRVDPHVPALREALLRWFDSKGRTLDFRASSSAWGILVGEVMAQQTQVSRVEPAWRAFMARYPTPQALAVAPIADVLRAWAGLGYNRRALNLQRAAQRILSDHDGNVPSTVAELEQLPGVGAYTARAVGAVAFGIPVGAVDTNVRRVLTRMLTAKHSSKPRGELIQWTADSLVDPARPADWTHALMDVGATICRPMRVDCERCPLRAWCATAARASEARVMGGRCAGGGGRRRRGTIVNGRRGSIVNSGPGAAVTAPFHATNRWLRGRLIAQLVAAPDGAWQRFDHALGTHSAQQVEQALSALAHESLIERNEDGAVRLPVDRQIPDAVAVR